LPTYSCKYCIAVFWLCEKNITESKKCNEITYSNCCKNGKIKIPVFKQPPEFLSMLLTNKENHLSKQFLPKIR
jgi:hypothetical protein